MHAGSSLGSLGGLPARPSIEGSMRLECEELNAVPSTSEQPCSTAQTKLPRNRHTPTISWSDQAQQEPIRSSPTSPKPLQILPTHLSIPDSRIVHCTKTSPDLAPDHFMPSVVDPEGSPPSAKDSTAVDMACIASDRSATSHASDAQEPCMLSVSNEAEHLPKSSMIEHEGSMIVNQDSIIVHVDSVILHEDSLVVHDALLEPEEAAGKPVAEGNEDAASSSDGPERTSGVSFSPEPRRNLHRHKSSNYSRLLDFRLDEWLPRNSDPLNIPEDLRENSEDLRSAIVSRSGISTTSFSESKIENIAMQRRSKRANSDEIMAMLPDKLRSQAEHAQSLADSALNSFVIVNAALQRSAALGDYVTRQDVKKRMGSDFRVGMGFGLHAGWSIEGAIGSRHKVDASYLSPNVNMAARLESATKQYGVSILMSSDFTALLSSAVRAKCRQIDTVLVKGSSQPMGIWTVDTDTKWVTADKPSAGGSWPDPSMYVHNSKTDLERTSTLDEFESHEDIVTSYCASGEFLEKWKMAFNHYKSGAWREARSAFEETYTMRHDPEGNIVRDIPSKVLMDFMAKTQFCAPGDWNGHRELTEK